MSRVTVAPGRENDTISILTEKKAEKASTDAERFVYLSEWK